MCACSFTLHILIVDNVIHIYVMLGCTVVVVKVVWNLEILCGMNGCNLKRGKKIEWCIVKIIKLRTYL